MLSYNIYDFFLGWKSQRHTYVINGKQSLMLMLWQRKAQTHIHIILYVVYAEEKKKVKCRSFPTLSLSFSVSFEWSEWNVCMLIWQFHLHQTRKRHVNILHLWMKAEQEIFLEFIFGCFRGVWLKFWHFGTKLLTKLFLNEFLMKSKC